MEKMVAYCKEATFKSAWQKKTGTYLDKVYVEMATEITDEEFNAEGFETGETLFQQLCLDLKEKEKELCFEGICRFESEQEKIRIKAYCREKEMTFHLKKTGGGSQRFQTQNYYLDHDGRMKKGEGGTCHERKHR